MAKSDEAGISPHGDATPARGRREGDRVAPKARPEDLPVEDLPVEDLPVEGRPVEDLPVVARMVVEIRSDGRRTVARGALQDHGSGAEVAVRAEGSSPLALAMSLARSLTALPAIAGAGGRARRIGRPSLRGALRRVARRLGGGDPRAAGGATPIETTARSSTTRDDD